MKGIYIPASVEYIGRNLTYNCNFLYFYYFGTREQWDSVMVDEYNEDLIAYMLMDDQQLPVRTRGDTNGNGLLESEDALVMRKYPARLITKDEISYYADDVNGDGNINALDQFHLRKMLAE